MCKWEGCFLSGTSDIPVELPTETEYYTTATQIEVGTLVKIVDTEDLVGINVGDIALVTEVTEDDDLCLYFPKESYHWAYYSPSSVEVVKDLLADYRGGNANA